MPSLGSLTIRIIKYFKPISLIRISLLSSNLVIKCLDLASKLEKPSFIITSSSITSLIDLNKCLSLNLLIRKLIVKTISLNLLIRKLIALSSSLTN